MSNNIKQNIILLLYSWVIYNLYVVFLSHSLIIDWGFFGYIGAMIGMLSSISIFVIFFNNMKFFITPPVLWFLLFCILCGITTLWFWWKKQTLARAWLLSLVGVLAGPGMIFVVPTRFPIYHPIHPFSAVIYLNIFFTLLVIINFLQKKFWPSNKICNKIRRILQWPCIRV